MKYLRIIISTISLILLGFLFANNLNQIDFAKMKNNANYRERISQVENFRNIEELRSFAIEQINYLKKNREINSENAITRNWIIIILFLLNTTLFVISRKKTIKNAAQ